MNAMTTMIANDSYPMTALQVYFREARAELVRAWRTPAFALPTLLMPLAFYCLFGLLFAGSNADTARDLLAGYGILAALGPSLFGFGAGIAADRDNGILALKRVSPLPPGAFLAARLACALVFTLIVLLCLYALAAGAGGVTLPAATWLTLLAIQLTSVLPFCLLGLCIGLSTGSSAAMALTNIAFASLAVLGGLWMPLSLFPTWLQDVAIGLPTYHLDCLALAAVRGHATTGTLVHALATAGFIAAFGGFAWRAWAAATR
jgi:ABC-2 type transport system permease protein